MAEPPSKAKCWQVLRLDQSRCDPRRMSPASLTIRLTPGKSYASLPDIFLLTRSTVLIRRFSRYRTGANRPVSSSIVGKLESEPRTQRSGVGDPKS